MEISHCRQYSTLERRVVLYSASAGWYLASVFGLRPLIRLLLFSFKDILKVRFFSHDYGFTTQRTKQASDPLGLIMLLVLIKLKSNEK